MSLYLLFVLFAYYILKPVSRALFLYNLDIDKLPWLYILIAGLGGIMAYAYSKLAVKSSLVTAVNWATILMVACLFLFWWLLPKKYVWIYYAFNIWVSLFSIVLVSQGWLVAANVFNSREAKRLYGLLGLGSVIGAAFGGSFTAATVEVLGVNNLLIACAVMVGLAYACFRGVIRQPGVSLAGARGADEEEADFSFFDIVKSIKHYRHLQVIIGIIALTYIVDVMVEYQFSDMAKQTYRDREDLTAFLGNFYGLWLNLITFVLQFFLTAVVVNNFGVGGTLQIMPLSIAAASIATFVSPGVLSTAAARLTEAATRYSFNRTGMELLYLPLPAEMKNRTKAFVDVFADRLSRGMGGMLLILLTGVLHMQTKNLSLVVMGITVGWIVLSYVAQREYVSTVRQRLASRRLNLEEARMSVRDPETVRLLEEAASGPHPRQVGYAVSLLAESPGYRIGPLLDRLSNHTSAEVLSQVLNVARTQNYPGLIDAARRDLEVPGVTKAAVNYLMWVSPNPEEVTAQLSQHANPSVRRNTLEALESFPELARGIFTPEWLTQHAASGDPHERCLAAIAVKVRGDQGTSVLFELLGDDDPEVVRCAMSAAAVVQNRDYIELILRRLAVSSLRGDAVEALAGYGQRILGTLTDVLLDERAPMSIRKQIPRVFSRIPVQRAVDVLIGTIDYPDVDIRLAVLRALNKLRETTPTLEYGPQSVTTQILQEARYYYQISAALEPLRAKMDVSPATNLLVRTLQERMKRTLERLFRLLGLRYPPKEIYAAYLAVDRGRPEEYAAAIEFLDNTLERELKRTLMPLLDTTAPMGRNARDLFGVEQQTPKDALVDLLRSKDPWLMSCAAATAAELKLTEMREEVARAARTGSAEVAQVALAAEAALA